MNTLNLSVLAYANNFTLWHYVTEDTLSTITSPGYFNKAACMCRRGDKIIVNAKDVFGDIWVMKNDGDVVEVKYIQ